MFREVLTATTLGVEGSGSAGDFSILAIYCWRSNNLENA
jgi:hypothetical protein